MAAARVLVVLLLLGGAASTELRKNPIRKVVTMLQDMQKSVEEEGETEKDLFEKFMCYCQNGEGALAASIDAGKASIEQLTGQVEKGTAEKSQLDQDIVQHKADREEAEKVMKEATAMREKEAAEFVATSGDMKSNLQAMGGALAALKKGAAGAALLQTGVGQFIANIIKSSPLVRDGERGYLLSFLEDGDASGMQGGSDQIVGILEQMKETMEGDLKEAEATEAESQSTFDTLMSSKTAEVGAAGKAIETKMARSGEVAVTTVQANADLESTKKAVAEDEDFKANLAKNCEVKQKEWDERCKLRAQEIEAISDTIEMLNSDDALELFKKNIPSASFLQTSASTSSRARLASRRAGVLIRRAMARDRAHASNRHLILASLGSGMGGFEKVVGMVDGMVGVLEEEQVKDDKQDAFCLAELEAAEKEAKGLAAEIEDLKAQVEEQTDAIESIASEIEALKEGLVELDKSVAEATELRKKEHAEAIDTAAGNQAAIELLGMAKNRLNKFYNPTLYKEPPKKEEEEFFAQVSASAMSFGKYKKSEASGGIIAMLGDMVTDVEKDMAEAKRDEAEAQKDYEEEMADAAKKREDDSKLIVTEEGEKAEKTGTLEDTKESMASKSDQLKVMKEKIGNLHKTCDFLLEHYAKMREERAKEEEGLKTSKQVLAGAKFGFMQKA